MTVTFMFYVQRKHLRNATQLPWITAVAQETGKTGAKLAMQPEAELLA